MTEEEMKKTWCPHARVVIIVEFDGKFIPVAGNRVIKSEIVDLHSGEDRANPSSARCLGSTCSQWRWESEIETDHDNRGYVSGRYKTYSSIDGYCGLAGKP